jgi:Uma2 family endonuclease
VRTPAGIRYPDVMVHRPGSGSDLATSTPVLIAEILSPSSMADDFGPKAQDYLAIESLRHYLVLSQDEPRVWLWSRTENGWGKPAMTAGAAEPLQLSGLGAMLDLGRLYAGIGHSASQR